MSQLFYAPITAISIFPVTQLDEDTVQLGFVIPHLTQQISRGIFDGISVWERDTVSLMKHMCCTWNISLKIENKGQ